MSRAFWRTPKQVFETSPRIVWRPQLTPSFSRFTSFGAVQPKKNFRSPMASPVFSLGAFVLGNFCCPGGLLSLWKAITEGRLLGDNWCVLDLLFCSAKSRKDVLLVKTAGYVVVTSDPKILVACNCGDVVALVPPTCVQMGQLWLCFCCHHLWT